MITFILVLHLYTPSEGVWSVVGDLAETVTLDQCIALEEHYATSMALPEHYAVSCKEVTTL